MEDKTSNFEASFNIDKVSFKNVSEDFERKFKERYSRSLNMMADVKDPLTNANGANSLEILEKMATRIKDYRREDDFEESYRSLLQENEGFRET